MADRTIDSTINAFKEVLRVRLRALEARRRTDPPTPGPTRDEIVEGVETGLIEARLQPWQLYLPILTDTSETPGFRSTAVQLLHNPDKVPEDAAPQIADAIVAIMREQGLGYGLGPQAVMAASILRPDTVTPMLQISGKVINKYFIPFAAQIPTAGQGQSQSEVTLGHLAQMLASIARFTVVHGHAYDGLLSRSLTNFYEAQAEFQSELEREGRLYELRRGVPRGFSAIGHTAEHLAELMEQGTLTKNRRLVELLVGGGVVRAFASLLEQRVVLGIAGGDIPRYLKQSDGFLAAVKEMGMKVETAR